MQSNSGPPQDKVRSTLSPLLNSENQQNSVSNQNPRSDSEGKTRDDDRKKSDFNPPQDYDEVSNTESKKPSVQEINNEIDLKKNRNRSISAVLAGCAVVPMVVLGLMAFGVINVSSLVLFSGYGASEVVLGLVGVSAVSQISLALVGRSGISKVEEKKPRIYDGVNPSIEQDIHDRKLRDEREKKKQEELQGRSDNKTPKWKDKLESQRRVGGSQRGL